MTTTARKAFYTPNGRDAVLDRWRSDGRIRAIGAITLSGGIISGIRLAAVIGVSPRGLRQLLRSDTVFVPEIRGNDEGRGETWYRLNLEALPEVLPPPPLMATLRLTHSKRRNCDPVGKPLK